MARGWGPGGLQVTLGVIGPDDVLKIIDQGDDGGVNATNLRRIVSSVAGFETATDTRESTVIQTRHRIPEEDLREQHVLVFQVPVAEPLREVQKSVAECGRMHAEADYSAIWVSLYEDIVRNGFITTSTGYPVLVGGRYVMATSPVPRWDIPRLDQAAHLSLYGAGRERRSPWGLPGRPPGGGHWPAVSIRPAAAVLARENRHMAARIIASVNTAQKIPMNTVRTPTPTTGMISPR